MKSGINNVLSKAPIVFAALFFCALISFAKPVEVKAADYELSGEMTTQDISGLIGTDTDAKLILKGNTTITITSDLTITEIYAGNHTLNIKGNSGKLTCTDEIYYGYVTINGNYDGKISSKRVTINGGTINSSLIRSDEDLTISGGIINSVLGDWNVRIMSDRKVIINGGQIHIPKSAIAAYTNGIRAGSGIDISGENTYIEARNSTTLDAYSAITTNHDIITISPSLEIATPDGGQLNSYRNNIVDSAGNNAHYVVIQKLADQVAKPTFSPDAGDYTEAQSVEISCTTPSAEIYYSTDGTSPTKETGTKYTSAISVSKTTTIKAVAVKEGWINSSVAIAKYTISDSPVPPIPPTPPITETCTISFDANGGKGEMKDQTVDKGVKTQLNANTFTRDGYTFDSWNTQADGKGKSYEDKDYITAEKDITLYAQWEKDEPGPTPTPTPTPRPRPRPRDDDDDESSSSEEASTPAVVNPDTVEGYFAVNGQLVPGVTMGKTKQGVAAQAVFNANRPVGWQEAFTFNMAINGKVDYTLKNGVLTIIIPKEFQKAGRTFAIMALDKNGKAWTFADTDTNPSTVTATINVEGYAFALIYKD